jgi:hypothetical protein
VKSLALPDRINVTMDCVMAANWGMQCKAFRGWFNNRG